MSTHQERVEVFQDTIAWINADPDLSASIPVAKKNTTVYYEDDYPMFDQSVVRNTKITVSGGSRNYDVFKKAFA